MPGDPCRKKSVMMSNLSIIARCLFIVTFIFALSHNIWASSSENFAIPTPSKIGLEEVADKRGTVTKLKVEFAAADIAAAGKEGLNEVEIGGKSVEGTFVDGVFRSAALSVEQVAVVRSGADMVLKATSGNSLTVKFEIPQIPAVESVRIAVVEGKEVLRVSWAAAASEKLAAAAPSLVAVAKEEVAGKTDEKVGIFVSLALNAKQLASARASEAMVLKTAEGATLEIFLDPPAAIPAPASIKLTAGAERKLTVTWPASELEKLALAKPTSVLIGGKEVAGETNTKTGVFTSATLNAEQVQFAQDFKTMTLSSAERATRDIVLDRPAPIPAPTRVAIVEKGSQEVLQVKWSAAQSEALGKATPVSIRIGKTVVKGITKDGIFESEQLTPALIRAVRQGEKITLVSAEEAELDIELTKQAKMQAATISLTDRGAVAKLTFTAAQREILRANPVTSIRIGTKVIAATTTAAGEVITEPLSCEDIKSLAASTPFSLLYGEAKSVAPEMLSNTELPEPRVTLARIMQTSAATLRVKVRTSDAALACSNPPEKLVVDGKQTKMTKLNDELYQSSALDCNEITNAVAAGSVDVIAADKSVRKVTLTSTAIEPIPDRVEMSVRATGIVAEARFPAAASELLCANPPTAMIVNGVSVPTTFNPATQVLESGNMTCDEMSTLSGIRKLQVVHTNQAKYSRDLTYRQIPIVRPSVKMEQTSRGTEIKASWPEYARELVKCISSPVVMAGDKELTFEPFVPESLELISGPLNCEDLQAVAAIKTLMMDLNYTQLALTLASSEIPKPTPVTADARESQSGQTQIKLKFAAEAKDALCAAGPKSISIDNVVIAGELDEETNEFSTGNLSCSELSLLKQAAPIKLNFADGQSQQVDLQSVKLPEARVSSSRMLVSDYGYTRMNASFLSTSATILCADPPQMIFVGADTVPVMVDFDPETQQLVSDELSCDQILALSQGTSYQLSFASGDTRTFELNTKSLPRNKISTAKIKATSEASRINVAFAPASKEIMCANSVTCANIEGKVVEYNVDESEAELKTEVLSQETMAKVRGGAPLTLCHENGDTIDIPIQLSEGIPLPNDVYTVANKETGKAEMVVKWSESGMKNLEVAPLQMELNGRMLKGEFDSEKGEFQSTALTEDEFEALRPEASPEYKSLNVDFYGGANEKYFVLKEPRRKALALNIKGETVKGELCYNVNWEQSERQELTAVKPIALCVAGQLICGDFVAARVIDEDAGILADPVFTTSEPISAVLVEQLEAGKVEVLYEDGDHGMIGNAFLAVSLVSFEAAAQDGSVLLDWQTASEVDNESFEVQRSATGEQWEVVGTIAGAGTTVEHQWYDFRDGSPFTGESFYRLVMIETDGSKTTSPVRTIWNEQGDGEMLYPNPFSHTLYTSAQIFNHEGSASLSISDAQGRIVRSIQIDRSNAQIDLTELPAGLYFARVNGSTSVIKLSKAN